MSEVLKLKDLQLIGLTEKIELLLKGLDKSKRPELDLAEVGTRLDEFVNALAMGQLELSGSKQKGEYTKIFRDHKSALKELKAEYDWRKANTDKKTLLAGARSSTAADATSSTAMMSHGIKVQDQSLAALQRIRANINDAKEIGIHTVTQLNQQTNTIADIHDKIESVDSTLARSTNVIKRMARRMVTDKVIWVFTFLILVAIIFILVYQYKFKAN